MYPTPLASATQIPASPSMLIALALIAAIPLVISSIASVISASNARSAKVHSKVVADQTVPNSGSTMKDDLLLLRSAIDRMEGTQSLLVSSFATHVADTEAHARRAREEAVRVADNLIHTAPSPITIVNHQATTEVTTEGPMEATGP